MAQGKPIPDATRAAIMAALLTGQSVGEASRGLDIAKSTVSRIKARMTPLDLQAAQDARGNELETLVLEYVRTNLETLTAQSRVAGMPEYIQAQPASELAVLHGMIAEKTFRILSALRPADPIKLCPTVIPEF